MKFADKTYSYNTDGSVRAEFITRADGIIPLNHFAEMLGVNVADLLDWQKSDLRGMVLDAKYVNDDGIKCDADGNPVETTSFLIANGKESEKWDQYFWVRNDGHSVLDDAEWTKLSSKDQASYRKLRCMKAKFSTLHFTDEPIYICEEAVSVLADLLRRDVWTGDPIVKRYQYECQYDEDFAARYGFAISVGLEDLRHGLVYSDALIIRHARISEMRSIHGKASIGTKPNTGTAHRIGDGNGAPEYKYGDMPESEEG